MFYKIIFVKKIAKESLEDIPANAEKIISVESKNIDNDSKIMSKNMHLSNTEGAIIRKINIIEDGGLIYHYVNLGNGKIIIMEQTYYESQPEDAALAARYIEEDVTNDAPELESFNDVEYSLTEKEFLKDIEASSTNAIDVNDAEEVKAASTYQVEAFDGEDWPVNVDDDIEGMI